MQALQNTNPLLLALGGAAAVGGVFLLSRLSSSRAAPSIEEGCRDGQGKKGRIRVWMEERGVSPAKCARAAVCPPSRFLRSVSSLQPIQQKSAVAVQLVKNAPQVVHELLGLVVLGVSTAGCYYMKPLERMINFMRAVHPEGKGSETGLRDMVDTAMKTAERKVGALLDRLRLDVSPAFVTRFRHRHLWLRWHLLLPEGLKFMLLRLTRAWAEGIVVRSLLSPILFPLKLWAAACLVRG